MKRFVSMILCSLLCTGSVAITSCTDKDEPKASLKPSTQSVQLNAAGDLQQITITTNQPTWSASRPEADSWCTLQRDGEGTLLIIAETRKEITPRTTQATIMAGTISIPVTITQAGAAPILTLDKQQVDLDITGTAQTVNVTTNLSGWTASRPDADAWCTLSKQGNTLSISATLCTVAERRTTVTVTATDGDGFNQPITVVQKGGTLTYQITIPTDFSESAVQKVIYNNKKIAEICQEYIRSEDKQMTVVYPVVDGKADLTQGFETATGGRIVWNSETNTQTYTSGSAQNLTKVWVEDGEVKGQTESKNIVTATVSSDLLVDVRGASSEVYRIVKIGTQYWMAENLRAERYLDGVTIATEWKDNTTGAYCYLYNTPADHKATYGALYSGFAALNAAGLAPEGWAVPNNAAWTKLRTYIGTPYGTKLKAKGGWVAGNGSGVTGFDALPALSYNTALGFIDTTVDTWFWSTDLTYDLLTRKNSQFYARLTDSSTGMTFTTNTSTGTFHGQEFGHSVRCVRK